ncbi:fatty acid CoA ligase family protein [Streptomyces sp. NPDC059680]|uniref:fatty acid CoA ligase family protein n=1 Tax=Streptomyces sp. NPDC059680 TaxID=3346904 RepID=UPI0036B334BE
MSLLAQSALNPDAGLADHLKGNADDFPDKAAIVYPDGRESNGSIRFRELTYAQLHADVERLAAGMAQAGIGKGTKTVLMVRPGPDFYALIFALFRLGAVPVVVDPGMGLKRMLHCYRSVGAEALIGLPVAHAARVIARRAFGPIRTNITVGRRWFWGGETLAGIRHATSAVSGERPTGDDLLMIGFTTGSTGPAKGVEYTHRQMTSMAQRIHDSHGYGQDDTALVTLPMYGVLGLLLGATHVLAPFDPTKIAEAPSEPVVQTLTRFDVTTMAASPALLRVLATYLAGHPTALPALRQVISGGAPTSPDIITSLRRVMEEETTFHVTYGATEALPISSIESQEILAETVASASAGAGTCVGRPLKGMDVRLVRIADHPLPRWETELAVPDGEIGEIAVAGESVSQRYHRNPTADAEHKIHEEQGDVSPRIWHRTGDLGYFDASGRLWFTGRRTQRVTTAEGDLHTVSCEGVFNAHPLVRRSALVGVGRPGAQRPVVCVETELRVNTAQWHAVVHDLRKLAEAQPVTKGIEVFLPHPAFPVDIRHNAKIGREQLAEWAGQHLTSGRGALSWKTRALRAIPLLGWAYLPVRFLLPADQQVLTVLWWIDAFLSIVVHAAQIPLALPRARAAGRGGGAAAALTMLYGATWWRTLPAPAPTDGEREETR